MGEVQQASKSNSNEGVRPKLLECVGNGDRVIVARLPGPRAFIPKCQTDDKYGVIQPGKWRH